MSTRSAAWLLALATLAAAGAPAAASDPATATTPATPATPDAATIVRQNVQARGGRAAWCAVQAVVMKGHVESRDAPTPSIPFTLQQQRPNRMRFDLAAMNQKNIRAFDGQVGWKVLPTSSGRPDVQDFRPEENRFMSGAAFLDAPLIDCAGDGSVTAVLEGSEQIDGHEVWRLGLDRAGGTHYRLWIDATTGLERRIEREMVQGAGQAARVAMDVGDYREFEGIQLPTWIQGGSGTGGKSVRMVMEGVLVNPELDARTFARPQAPRGKGIQVDTRSAQASPGAQRPLE